MRCWLSLALIATAGCAMEGEPGLVLDRAWWRTPDVLRVSLWTDADGAFELDDGGVREPGYPVCFGERCVLTFLDVEAPRHVYQRVGERERGAPILECGEDPFGLCPFGLTCVDRACVPVCAPHRPDGACVEDGARCVEGTCVVGQET